MFVNVAVYRIHAQHVETFKTRIARQAEISMRDEPNCLQFAANQSRSDPTIFVMYEVFRSEDDFQTHVDAPHTRDFVKSRDEEGWLADRTLYQLDPVSTPVAE